MSIPTIPRFELSTRGIIHHNFHLARFCSSCAWCCCIHETLPRYFLPCRTMARSKGTVKDSTNVHRRKLRSSTSTAKVSETNCNVPSTSSSVQQGNSSSKKRKVQVNQMHYPVPFSGGHLPHECYNALFLQASSTEVVGSGTKTPKISKQDKDQQPEPGSSNSKYSVINLHSSFKEHSGRSKSPPINFKVNILKPVQDHRPTLPRFKRTPVQNPAMCADVAENILDMCFEQEVSAFILNTFLYVCGSHDCNVYVGCLLLNRSDTPLRGTI